MNGLAWAIACVAALNGVDTVRSATPGERALDYQTVTLTKEFVVKGDSVPSGAKVKFRYPEFVGGPDTTALQAINRMVTEFWAKHLPYGTVGDPDSIATGFLSGYRSHEDEYKGLLGYDEEFETRVILEEWPILSFHFEWSAYTGGPHVNELYFLSSIDERTGAVLTLDDLLIRGSRDSLDRLGESILRKDRGIEDTVPLTSLGYEFPDDVFRLNDNFCVTREGLRFFFNEYENSSYRPGGTTIVIPFEYIRGLVRRDGPLAGRGTN
jgi:hypothetical protein